MRNRIPSAFVVCVARNPIAKNKEIITPPRMDVVNGISGYKSALISGTTKVGSAIMNMTNGHFGAHKVDNAILPKLSSCSMYKSLSYNSLFKLYLRLLTRFRQAETRKKRCQNLGS